MSQLVIYKYRTARYKCFINVLIAVLLSIPTMPAFNDTFQLLSLFTDNDNMFPCTKSHIRIFIRGLREIINQTNSLFKNVIYLFLFYDIFIVVHCMIFA